MKQWFWKYWKRNSTGLWPLKGGKQRKVTPATKSAYFLEAVSRLWHSHTQPAVYLSGKEEGWSSERPWTLGLVEEWQRRGSYTEIWRKVPSSLGQVPIHTYMRRNRPGLGKNPENQVSGTHVQLEIVHIPFSQSGKTSACKEHQTG